MDDGGTEEEGDGTGNALSIFSRFDADSIVSLGDEEETDEVEDEESSDDDDEATGERGMRAGGGRGGGREGGSTGGGGGEGKGGGLSRGRFFSFFSFFPELAVLSFIKATVASSFIPATVKFNPSMLPAISRELGPPLDAVCSQKSCSVRRRFLATASSISLPQC